MLYPSKVPGVTKRVFTDAEIRCLSERQKAYLEQHPSMAALQSSSMLMPSEQLYASLLHGAVTIDRALELDEVARNYRRQEARVTRDSPYLEYPYTNEEETFVQQHGMSSALW